MQSSTLVNPPTLQDPNVPTGLPGPTVLTGVLPTLVPIVRERTELDALTHRHRVESGTAAKRHSATVLKPGATVYVIGDLEGQLHRLYNLLVSLKIISVFRSSNQRCKTPVCDWLAADHVYVVQCGDQIDAGGKVLRHVHSPHFDLETLVFTDYLQEISGGHFINIIGNHEWMNVYGELDYVHPSDTQRLSPARRRGYFTYDGILGKILRRRHFTLRINNAVFSHAGISQELFPYSVFPDAKNATNATTNMVGGIGSIGGMPFTDENLGVLFDRINGLVDVPANFRSSVDSTPEFKWYIWGPIAGTPDFENDHSIIWNRHYSIAAMTDHESMRAAVPGFPFMSEIDVMVTGHNKNADIIVYPNVPSNERKDMNISNQKILLLSDAISQEAVLKYAVLKADAGSLKFTALETAVYACSGGSCALFDTEGFTADYIACVAR